MKRIGRNNPFRLFYKTFLRLTKSSRTTMLSTKRIDILIPVAEKDLETLPTVVECARKNILNPIGEIIIVGKKGIIETQSNMLNCTFIDEDFFLPIKKRDIVFKGKEWHRSGWLFQQLIKLNADAIAKNEHILVLDSDTCITQKQTFVFDDYSVILNFSDEYHFPYGAYTRFINLQKRFFLSFVTHHMIFSKTTLNNLKKDIERFTGKAWIEGILQNIDYNEPCCFSEYELYGNYVYFNFPDKCHLEYWNNKGVKNESVKIKESYKNYKSVSFHQYS